MTTKDIFQTMVAIGVVVGMVIGAITYFATAEDLRLTQQRLDQKIINDRVIDHKRLMYEIEKENKGKAIDKWSEKDKKMYFELEQELKRIMEEKKEKK